MEFIRGDTAKFKFRRHNADGNVIATPADEIYFTVKTNGYSDNVLLQKTLADMTFDENYYYHFTILPEDTDNLDYGTYQYDVEIIQDGNKTTTRGEFIIDEEITFASDEGASDEGGGIR